jgi:beta-glucosidase
MTEKIKAIIASLTLEEKASLCSGRDFWNLRGVEGKGVPSIMVTDGPHGLRKQEGSADHVGLGQSVPATCFPTASALASSWDTELLTRVGAALGEECRQEKVAVLLGPGVNIKRSPLCGRNFEYFSEDPFLSGKLGASLIRGVESQGIGTSLKHFAVNNQERRRMTIDVRVDQRTLRELYLPGFEIAVKEGMPRTVMCAYNRLNGTYCSENKALLTDILKKEWKFPGLVVTDWGAVNHRVRGLEAGLDLEMPGSGGMNDRLIVRAVRDGSLDEKILDESLERILGVVLGTSETLEDDFTYDSDEHHRLARRAAGESAVLLKNEGLLPLNTDARIAVIGAFAQRPRYQGSGSSLVNPQRLDTPWKSIRNRLGPGASVLYAAGYNPEKEEADPALIAEAVETARAVDAVLIFAGLPDICESEGFDRTHLEMPEGHNRLIEAVAGVNARTAVILSNGAPVLMPWLDQVNAVLEGYLGGQAWGSAAADLIFGDVNPSGKLAETFPLNLEQGPAAPNFPGGSATVAYAESIYVGYRYFDTAGEAVLFPFGHGLSYTSFTYSDLSVTPDNGGFDVDFRITNTGKVRGKEAAQVYLGQEGATVFRPEKELKGFSKIDLAPGETKEIKVRLDRRSFAVWDQGKPGWTVESGTYQIMVGASSRDIRLRGSVTITDGEPLSAWAAGLKKKVPDYFRPRLERFGDLSPTGDFSRLLEASREGPLPPPDRDPSAPFTRTSTLEETGSTLLGRLVQKIAMGALKKMLGDKEEPKTVAMMQAMVREMPLKNFGMLGGVPIPMETIDGLILILNRHLFKGLIMMLKGGKR